MITNAANGADNVKALVYVDAFIPDEGETVFQILGGSGSAFDIPDPTAVFDIAGYPGAPEGDAEAFLKPDTVHSSFAQDLPEADRRLIAAGQRPITLARQHHAVRSRRVEVSAELGRDRHRGPCDPAGHATPHGRAGGATITDVAARTSRWSRIRRSPSTRSSPPRQRSATDPLVKLAGGG